MSIKNQGLLFLLILTLLAGCASPGAFLDDSSIGRIQPGMTRQEVWKIIGAPDSSEKGPDFTQLDEYRVLLDQPSSSNPGSFSGQISLRSFQVLYDKNGKVWYRESFRSLIPYWQEVDGTVRGGIRGGLKAIPAIELNATHITDLTSKLGEPMLIDTTLDGNRHYHWFVCKGAKNSILVKITGELVVALNRQGHVSDYRIIE